VLIRIFNFYRMININMNSHSFASRVMKKCIACIPLLIALFSYHINYSQHAEFKRILELKETPNERFGSLNAFAGNLGVVTAPGYFMSGPNFSQAHGRVYFLRREANSNWIILDYTDAPLSYEATTFYGQGAAVNGDYAAVSQLIDGQQGFYFVKVVINQFSSPNYDNVSVNKTIGVKSYYSGLQSFGIPVALSASVVFTGLPDAYESGTDAAGAVYLNNISSGALVKTLEPTGMATDTEDFGYALSLSGDILAVGAPGETTKGAVYIFSRNQGGTDNWGLVKKFTTTDGNALLFGANLSLSGNILAVGAKKDKTLGADAGAVYMFSKDQGGTNNWGQVKKITASGGAAGDQFGESVSVAGNEVVIGAPRHNSGATMSGQSYVFSKDIGGTNNWGLRQVITNSVMTAGDQVGSGVAINGTDILIGAPGSDRRGDNSGEVLAYKQDGTGTWNFVKSMSQTLGKSNAYFGTEGDIEGDKVIIDDQVFMRNEGGTNFWGNLKAGSSAPRFVLSGEYIYQIDRFCYSGGLLIYKNDVQIKTICNPDEGANSPGMMTKDLAVADNILIASSYDGPEDYSCFNCTTVGASFIFHKDQGGIENWGLVKKIVPPDAISGDYFGTSIAVEGTTAAISSVGDDDNGKSNSGSVYIYEMNQGGANNWGQVTKLTAPDGADNDAFGSSIALSLPYLFIGASNHNGYKGAVYVYKKTGVAWSLLKKVSAPESTNLHFGRKTAAEGVTLVAAGDNNQVYVFNSDQGGVENWGQISKLQPSNITSGDLFGCFVKINDGRILVGAKNNSNEVGNSAGAAYLFYVPPISPTLSTQTSLTASGFAISWNSVIGIDSYKVDLSTASDFSTFVSVYNGFSTTQTSITFSGLNPNQNYYVRVRSVKNLGGDSPNSNVRNPLTSPAAPVVNTGSSITQTGFVASWNTVAGATAYLLEVSTNSSFTSLLSGYPKMIIAPTISSTVPGLLAGQNYWYRVSATNGTSSINSNTVQVLTIPATPVANQPSSSGQSGFTASWSASTGATNYLLEVSTDNFITLLAGYSPKLLTSTSENLVNLASSTSYKFRVKATNGSGNSAVSNIITVLTAPIAPTANQATSITASGFTASWLPVSGVTTYLVDVSDNDSFNPLVVGYPKTVSATSLAVTNLNAGTIYKYKIRAFNGTASANSGVISVLTLPGSPVATITPSSISQTGFLLNWASVTGASSYTIEISSDNFNTFVSNYGPKLTSLTSENVMGLNPGTSYTVRVKAFNATGSSVSTQLTTVTLPAKPELNVPSQITQNGFTIDWAALTQITGYELEISSNEFVDLLTGYNPKVTTERSVLITTLSSGTVYKLRLRGYNTSGKSPYSNIVSQITKPANPVALDPAQIGVTSFKAGWTAPVGTDSYEFELSEGAGAFNPLPDYPKMVTGALDIVVTALKAKTVYKYRVRAINKAGASGNSNEKSIETLQVQNNNPLLISTPIVSGSKISVNVTGGSGIRAVKFYSKGITASTFVEKTLTSATDAFETTVSTTDFDELGLEYYFTALDGSVTVPVETARRHIYQSIELNTFSAIPFSSNFNGNASTYEMFSVPYEITEKSIASSFDELGAPDKTKWRLLRYQGGKYLEYPDNITTIDIGKGYWFNALQKVDIKTGEGKVTSANQATPFTITFAQGWNQIGNPYPFNIDWETIKNANAAAGLNSLWLFEGSKYVKKDVLATWKGAFVFSDNGGPVSFPVTAKTTSPGRTAKEELTPTLDEAAWQLPIKLSLNGLEQISAVGMHPEARASKDKFDEITIPRFIDYLEMNTYHEEFFAHHFASDMIATTPETSWLFTVSSNQKEGIATLTWNQQALLGNQSKIALIDLQEQTLLDMKSTSTYQFNWTEGRQFKILYSREGELLPGLTMLGNAYPNPFNTGTTIPFLLEENQTRVEISIYDILGRRVKTLSKVNNKAGIHSMEWNGNNEQGSAVDGGLYLYQLRGDKGILSAPKRLIKQ